MFGGREALTEPVRIALIGAGRIGTSHATLLKRRVAGARLVKVVDPRFDAAQELASDLGCEASSDINELWSDPEIEAVVIAASSTVHADLIVAAAEAGKAIFCEKPAGMSLAEIDRGVQAAKNAGVPLQVGFNRRFSRDFAAGHALIAEGAIGTPQLMRSVTRDPGLANPGGVPPWTIFTQTLIHDFDSLLWLNPGAEPLTVHATADALVAPDFKDGGLLDTAVVVITFDNGAIAVAEANFSAAYGYDIRGEVFGSTGMVTMGEGAASSMRQYSADGRRADTVRSDTDLFVDAYTAELIEFADAVREKREPSVTGVDARRAFTIAQACIESMEQDRTIKISEVDAR